MQKVFIYACEDSYGGLHGIEDMTVIEVNSLAEADATGREMSLGVIESYGLREEYEDEDEEDVGYEGDEGTCWEIYKIREDIHLTLVELDALCAGFDKETFIEMYCESDMWEEE